MTPKTETLYRKIEVGARKYDKTSPWLQVKHYRHDPDSEVVLEILEPVPVPVAGDLYMFKLVELKEWNDTPMGYRRLTNEGMEILEKVTHVLPKEDIKPPKVDTNEYPWYRKYINLKKSVEEQGFKIEDDGWGVSAKKETSDDYEKAVKSVLTYPYQKHVDELNEKNRVIDELQIDLSDARGSLIESIKEVESLKIERGELQKKIEELEKELSFVKISRGLAEGEVESQKQTIEKRGKEFDELLESKAELRRELESSTAFQAKYKIEIDRIKSENGVLSVTQKTCYDAFNTVAKDNERLKAELEDATREIQCGLSANKELAQLLEEAKNGGVKWEKCHHRDEHDETAAWDYEGKLMLGYGEYVASIPLPVKTKPRSVEEEAQEAYQKAYENRDTSYRFREVFIEGFKAAKESHGQV